jgi:RHS repeat-associated protein
LSNPPAALDVTRWNYEEATGLLINKVYADGKGPSYAYSPEGLLARRTWARGVITDYGYDAFGSLVSKSYSDETPAVSLCYNAQGKLLTAICDGVSTNCYAYNQFGQITNELQNGMSLARSYDSFGRPTGYCIGDGLAEGSSVSYAYDTSGRFSSVSSGTNTFAYSYLPGSSLVSGMTASTGHAWDRIYEPTRDLIATVHNRYGSRTISRFDYTNDEIGRRVARIDSGEAFSETACERYVYNARSEVIGSQRFLGCDITNQTCFVPNRSFGFLYDSIGNRIASQEKVDGQFCITSYTANELNQYTQTSNTISLVSFEYDDDGNMTFDGCFHYSWNGENRMCSAEGIVATTNQMQISTTWNYDVLGRMVTKTIFATDIDTQEFFWDDYNIVHETNNSNETYNVWGLDLDGTRQGLGGVGGLLVCFKSNNPGFAYYEASGNVTEYTSFSGQLIAHHEYTPFGEPIVFGSREFSHRFSTKPFCTSCGLTEYERRSESVRLGRWIARDPLGEDGGNNLYSFLENRVIQNVDLLGLKCCMTWMIKGAPSKSSHAILACDNGLYISFGPDNYFTNSKNQTKEIDFSKEHYGVIDFADLLTETSEDEVHETQINKHGTIRKFKTVCLPCIDPSKITLPTNEKSWNIFWNCADEVQKALRDGLVDQTKPTCSNCEEPADYLRPAFIMTPGMLFDRAQKIKENGCNRWHCIKKHPHGPHGRQ